eukprot:TRINITY_DN2544_c0_g2_i1.p1 TRINITY_DN2544_c0_g2~~TRINITY_DN2544_c0_g2_i1.p1  ORF type:complete len:644 (+),score=114.64 TRINITY_DN2544_c0_g2_i1:74-1933(+)
MASARGSSPGPAPHSPACPAAAAEGERRAGGSGGPATGQTLGSSAAAREQQWAAASVSSPQGSPLSGARARPTAGAASPRTHACGYVLPGSARTSAAASAVHAGSAMQSDAESPRRTPEPGMLAAGGAGSRPGSPRVAAPCPASASTSPLRHSPLSCPGGGAHSPPRPVTAAADSRPSHGPRPAWHSPAGQPRAAVGGAFGARYQPAAPTAGVWRSRDEPSARRPCAPQAGNPQIQMRGITPARPSRPGRAVLAARPPGTASPPRQLAAGSPPAAGPAVWRPPAGAHPEGGGRTLSPVRRRRERGEPRSLSPRRSPDAELHRRLRQAEALAAAAQCDRSPSVEVYEIRDAGIQADDAAWEAVYASPGSVQRRSAACQTQGQGPPLRRAGVPDPRRGCSPRRRPLERPLERPLTERPLELVAPERPAQPRASSPPPPSGSPWRAESPSRQAQPARAPPAPGEAEQRPQGAAGPLRSPFRPGDSPPAGAAACGPTRPRPVDPSAAAGPPPRPEPRRPAPGAGSQQHPRQSPARRPLLTRAVQSPPRSPPPAAPGGALPCQSPARPAAAALRPGSPPPELSPGVRRALALELGGQVTDPKIAGYWRRFEQLRGARRGSLRRR